MNLIQGSSQINVWRRNLTLLRIPSTNQLDMSSSLNSGKDTHFHQEDVYQKPAILPRKEKTIKAPYLATKLSHQRPE